jgi:hypothetical protein
MKSSIAKSVEEAKAMLETTSLVLETLESGAASNHSKAASAPIEAATPPSQRSGTFTNTLPAQASRGPAITAYNPDKVPESVPEVSREEKMDLYQQMDAMLDSIRDGTFKAEDAAGLAGSPAPKAPVTPAPSLAARPELYTSDGPTEAPVAPTTREYEELLAAGDALRFLALVSHA